MKTETEETKCFETQKKIFRAHELRKPGTEKKPQRPLNHNSHRLGHDI